MSIPSNLPLTESQLAQGRAWLTQVWGPGGVARLPAALEARDEAFMVTEAARLVARAQRDQVRDDAQKVRDLAQLLEAHGQSRPNVIAAIEEIANVLEATFGQPPVSRDPSQFAAELKRAQRR